jgi:Family of unknown function (DUF5317)
MGGVVLVALVVLAGVVAGIVQRGSFEGLTRAPVRLVPLLVGSLVLQLGVVLAQGLVRSPWPVVAVMLVSLTGLLGFALANLRLPGMTLIAIGLLCNLLVIGLNGGMPVSDGALARSGRAVGPTVERPDARHVLVDEGTRLPQLADALAVRPLGTVVSVGDVAQYAGLFLLVQGLMVGSSLSRRPRFQEFDYGVRGGR